MNMTGRIFKSICVAAIAVYLCSLVLLFGVLYNYFTSMQMSSVRSQVEFAAGGTESGGLDYLNSLDMADADDDSRVTWIAADGSVLFDTDADASQMENHLDREEVKEALSDGYGESMRYSSTLTEKLLYSAVRLNDGSVLRVSGTQYTPFTIFVGMLRPVIIIFAIAVALSLWLAFSLSRKITEPLNTMNLDNPDENSVYEELYPMVKRMHAQQNQLKQQAADAERMRREFTANVSHELKTPLHTISGCAELLSDGMVKPDDVPKFSGQIYAESRRMITLVDDIIKLSNLDEGAIGAEWADTDLYELAKKQVESLQSAAEAAGVRLSLNGESAPIHGIPQLLGGIISNLCDNAIKYNNPGGYVNVSIENIPESDSQTAEVKLTVRDNGIGIPKDQQSRVFERFYRVDKSHSKEVGGTGLGLSIVKHSVKLHKGRVELESEPGSGTTVTVHFPVS